MVSHRRIQVQGLAVLLIGGAFLATPARAAARANIPPYCGVCYSDDICGDGNSEDLDEDCQFWCGTDAATECIQGIEDGWECQAPGNWLSSIECNAE